MGLAPHSWSLVDDRRVLPQRVIRPGAAEAEGTRLRKADMPRRRMGPPSPLRYSDAIKGLSLMVSKYGIREGGPHGLRAARLRAAPSPPPLFTQRLHGVGRARNAARLVREEGGRAEMPRTSWMPRN